MTTNDGNFINKKGMLSNDALLGTLYNAGFTDPAKLAQAYAIARTESNGRPMAYNGNRGTGDNSYGMFQINMIDNLGTQRDKIFKDKVQGYTGYDSLYDPLVNARTAAYMSRGGHPEAGSNWRSWQKDLTSDRYLGSLPSTESVQKYIDTRKGIEKGMGTISRGNSFFESKKAASEGYQAPSTIAKNPYTGTYSSIKGISSLKAAPSSSAGAYAGNGKDERATSSSSAANPSGITSSVGSVGAIGSNAASLGRGSGGSGSYLY